MGKGLSKEQRRVLAYLVAFDRPLTSSELLELEGRKETKSARVSILRTLRRLELRGLVRLERLPGRGRGRIAATAAAGARGELYGADLQRARQRREEED
jgi:hypothetical protein